jgi:glyceraldehyde-3-phosphate dehydrogenase (NADP+) (phosphorylating)
MSIVDVYDNIHFCTRDGDAHNLSIACTSTSFCDVHTIGDKGLSVVDNQMVGPRVRCRPRSFNGLTSTTLPTKAEQTFTGRVQRQTATKATGNKTVASMKGKKINVAINGFGRIGRNFLRCWHGRGANTMLNIVAINDSGGVKQASHLVKYDSVLGTFEADVKVIDDTHISIDGKKIEIVSSRDPLQLPWKALGVDLVIEGTGVFIDTPGASKHITAGASKVLITAPAKGDDIPTYVLGVNADQYKHSDKIISNASCTTNGLAPFVKVIDEKFGLVKGLMTTTHSYTGDQRILDASHRDLRRARAAALNIVPTSTGAAKAVALVLPQLKGKLNGIALRVPTPNVSVVDLVVQTSKKVTADEVNAAFREAANGKLKGILAVSDEPLVSIDFRCTDVSTTIDAALTMVMGDDMLKIIAWYDNEWGYSQRVVDLAELTAANWE